MLFPSNLQAASKPTTAPQAGFDMDDNSKLSPLSTLSTPQTSPDNDHSPGLLAASEPTSTPQPSSDIVDIPVSTREQLMAQHQRKVLRFLERYRVASIAICAEVIAAEKYTNLLIAAEESIESLAQRLVLSPEVLLASITFFAQQNEKQLKDTLAIVTEYAAKIESLEAQAARIRSGEPMEEEDLPTPEEEDLEVTAQQAERLIRDIKWMVEGEMKYRLLKPTTSPSRWSFCSRDSTASVFFKIFGSLPVNVSERQIETWVKKITVEEFKYIVGDCDVPVDTGTLKLAGDVIQLTWNVNEKRFTMSGQYNLVENQRRVPGSRI